MTEKGSQIVCQTMKAYSEPCQISKTVCFVKIVNDFKWVTIFTKRPILDVWQGSEYASVVRSSIGSSVNTVPFSQYVLQHRYVARTFWKYINNCHSIFPVILPKNSGITTFLKYYF